MPHRSRLAGFIIDSRTDDLDASARFWSRALGAPVAAPDPGSDPGEADRYATLRDVPGGLYVAVQKVEHPSRVHLDIETDDIDAEVARLEALGAVRVGFVKRWWVMQAPDGQRFCVVKMDEGSQRATPNTWD